MTATMNPPKARIPESAIELYRSLKSRVGAAPRDPITGLRGETWIEDGGLSEEQDEEIRPWLKQNRGATATELLHQIEIMAAPNPGKRVGGVSTGTLKKARNIMAGVHPYAGAITKPGGWDDELDGEWYPERKQSEMITTEQREAIAKAKVPGTQTPAPVVQSPREVNKSGPPPGITEVNDLPPLTKPGTRSTEALGQDPAVTPVPTEAAMPQTGHRGPGRGPSDRGGK